MCISGYLTLLSYIDVILGVGVCQCGCSVLLPSV